MCGVWVCALKNKKRLKNKSNWKIRKASTIMINYLKHLKTHQRYPKCTYILGYMQNSWHIHWFILLLVQKYRSPMWHFSADIFRTLHMSTREYLYQFSRDSAENHFNSIPRSWVRLEHHASIPPANQIQSNQKRHLCNQNHRVWPVCLLVLRKSN